MKIIQEIAKVNGQGKCGMLTRPRGRPLSQKSGGKLIVTTLMVSSSKGGGVEWKGKEVKDISEEMILMTSPEGLHLSFPLLLQFRKGPLCALLVTLFRLRQGSFGHDCVF